MKSWWPSARKSALPKPRLNRQYYCSKSSRKPGIRKSCCGCASRPMGTEVFWAGYMLLGWGLFLLGHYAGLRYAPEFVQMAMARTKLVASSKYQEFIEDQVNVGFTVADDSGLMGSAGLVFIEGDQVMIEYQTSDALLGILKSGVREASIPIADITRARLEQKFWSADLVLQSRSLKVFRHLPGHAAGTLRLKINRQSAIAAQNLVEQINRLKQA